MIIKLVQDLSAITNVSQHALLTLIEKAQLCVCHGVHETLTEQENMTQIDIGLGTLYIKCEGSDVKYKFIPSKKLEESVSKTIQDRTSPLTRAAEISLKERIEGTYKELL